MGRLKTGELPQDPSALRKKYREDLLARGGSRLSTDIEADATRALAKIMAHSEALANKKEAVSAALIAFAAHLDKEKEAKPPAA
ncbi:hypothetical protein [Comamonas sp. HJ-2]